MTVIGPTDFSALFGLNTLKIHQRALDTTLERLATGKRINRASDDPAGTVLLSTTAARQQAVEAQINGLEFTRLLNDTASSAYSQVSDGLIRLQGILTQAANAGAQTPEEREALQQEADAILDSIDFTAENTVFNGKRLLNGEGVLIGTTVDVRQNAHTSALGAVTLSIPTGEFTVDHTAETLDDALVPEFESIDFSLADLRTGGRLNLIDGDLQTAQSVFDLAFKSINRAAGNTDDTGLAAQISVLSNELEALAKLQSEVGDTDFAKETSELARRQVLTQAATQVILINREQSASTALGLLG